MDAMPESTIIATVFAALSGAISILWRQTVANNREAVDQLKLTQAEALQAQLAVIQELRGANDRRIADLQAYSADQMKVAQKTIDDLKRIAFMALENSDKNLGVAKDVAKQLLGGGGPA